MLLRDNNDNNGQRDLGLLTATRYAAVARSHAFVLVRPATALPRN